MIFEHEWEKPTRVGESVIAAHPGHNSAFAPGKVVKSLHDGAGLQIRFYDGIILDVGREELDDVCILLGDDVRGVDANLAFCFSAYMCMFGKKTTVIYR